MDHTAMGFGKTLKEHNFALFHSCLCPTPLYNSTRLYFRNSDATDNAMVQVRPSYKLEMVYSSLSHRSPLHMNVRVWKVILWSNEISS